MIGGGQPAAAQRFARAYSHLTERLLEWPLCGRIYETDDPSLAGIRIGKIASPFQNYLVFYVPEGGVVRVLAVIHGAMGDTERRRLLGGRVGA